MKIIMKRIFGRSNHYNMQFSCQENHSEAYLTVYPSFIVIKVQLLTVLLSLDYVHQFYFTHWCYRVYLPTITARLCWCFLYFCQIFYVKLWFFKLVVGVCAGTISYINCWFADLWASNSNHLQIFETTQDHKLRKKRGQNRKLKRKDILFTIICRLKLRHKTVYVIKSIRIIT